MKAKRARLLCAYVLDRRRDLRLLGPYLRRRLTADGGWMEQAPNTVRCNLHWFVWNGVFAQASESILLSYLTLYVLALGATTAQIGLMSALSNLSAALLVLPGAALVERWGRRKQTVLWANDGVGRATLLPLALLPLFLTGSSAVYVAIALVVARTAFVNLSVPAWTSLVADIVPLHWRGRYFSLRNVAMGVAGMIVIFLVGQLITHAGAPQGYQLAMGVALALGLAATCCFARIQEPPAPQTFPVTAGRRLPLWQNLRHQADFVTFCAVAALWNLSVSVAGPFFGPYMVDELGANAGFVGLLGVVAGLAALPGQRLFGRLSDRWGPGRVQRLTGLLIPLVPGLWALSRSPWHLVPAELASGFLWAGYGLASFNFLLTLIPQDRRARYAALYQIVVTSALALGAALGGGLATWQGYRFTFAFSGLGRLVAALLFVRVIRGAAARPIREPIPADSSS